ncbi:TetR family transcriptional regulator [Leucobacter sp. CSA1]|uniref:TetR family transcriptional regulator n=1 Tax=Leucobacter chromiisoli TaxID=2796471 RepID=A0A934UTR8_9MICO|nr:TetR family transcriptional regulator [Leucobacter chromiisoli]MBK0418025.1 TetR family transcriptional regulator [Leucobacter chromiisoli]
MTTRASAGSAAPGGRGRPRASSREVLEEAAYELFLEQGFEGTTVAEIARRAGVSRGTFFNYFASKADVFWADIDEALAQLPGALRECERGVPPAEALSSGLVRLAAVFGPDRVPWILTQYEAMGSPAEVGVSALARLGRAAEELTQFLAERSGAAARDLPSRALSYAALGTLVAAARTWAEAGPARGRLSAHVERAFAAGPWRVDSAASRTEESTMTEHQFPVPRIEQHEERHLAVVREKVPFSGIAGLYDRAYPLVFDALRRAGVEPAAAPMGVVHGEPGETLDLSVAVPVAEPFTAAEDGGEVTAETLPGGRVATMLVRGDYSLISAGYERLFGWISEQGLVPAGISWEQYLTEPEPGGDPALNETLLGVPIAD